MKKVDRWAALTAALLLTVSLAPASQAAEAGEKIVILHTNDVHCALDDAIGYAGLAAYAGALEEQYGADRVTLVDAGDAIQGQAVGTLSQGEYIISLMNAAGYDLAVPGNHEFDYGVDRLMELAAGAEFPYLSCNFTGLAAGEPVFQPYALLDYGDTTVGYVGICTPESLTKTLTSGTRPGRRCTASGREETDRSCMTASRPQWTRPGPRARTMWWRWAIWVMRASLPSGPPRPSLPTPPASTCSWTATPMSSMSGHCPTGRGGTWCWPRRAPA